jgi:hypothetical protein
MLSGTYSELVRATTEAESLERAANNEIVAYLVDNDAIAVRAAYPTRKLFTYGLQRLLPASVAAMWDTFAGAGAEAGYIHHSGIRRQIANGWYVMNMGHGPYVNWQVQNTIKGLQGTFYGLPGQHPGLVMDGVLIDLTLWYPAFDHQIGLDLAHSPYEEILISDEYNGTGDAYQTACRNAFILTQQVIAAIYPAVFVYPNFGDLAFCGATDANTLAIIAACSLIEAQQALTYTNGEPNLNAPACVNRWAILAAMTGKSVLAHGLLISPQLQADKDRAKIGVCAWFMMAARTGLYARFATGVDLPADISTWEQPDLLHLASAMLGQAIAPYEVVSGSWTKGTVYKRQFLTGDAYLFIRNAGAVGSETAIINVQPQQALSASGVVGLQTTTLSLTLGEGALMLDAAINPNTVGNAQPDGVPGKAQGTTGGTAQRNKTVGHAVSGITAGAAQPSKVK